MAKGDFGNALNNILKIAGIGAIVVAIVLGVFLTMIFNKTAQGSEGTISVSGDYTMTVQPEQVQIYFATNEEGKDIAALQQSNADTIAALKEALGKSGLDYKIETTSFNVYPSYDYVDGRQVFRTNVLQQTVKITSKNYDSAGKLIDLGLASNIGIVQSVSFSLTDDTKEKTNNLVQAEAIKRAKEKASIMAKSGGFRLLRVLSISTGGFGYPTPIYARADMTASGAAEKAATPTEIQPQDLEVSATASITYSIR